MTNIKEIISSFRDRLQEFQVGKDYTASFGSKGEEKKEIYNVNSTELKETLREIVSIPSTLDSSSGYEIENCDSEGNCFSYKVKGGTSNLSDELLLLSGCQKKKKAKKEYGVDKETLTWEEVEQCRREVEQARKEVEKRRIEVEERREKGLPTSDYFSTTSRINWEGKTWEKNFSFDSDTGSQKIEEIFADSNHEQPQLERQQEAKVETPLRVVFPKKS